MTQIDTRPLLLGIEDLLHQKIIEIEDIGGGSINEARLIHTSTNKYFLKFSIDPSALSLFKGEIRGLNLLSSSCPRPIEIKTPQVIGLGKREVFTFLLLEYIEPNRPNLTFWENFAQSLAHLHKETKPEFGLDHSNHIGRLYQSNDWQSSWSDFYVNERLLPQISIAKNNQNIDSKTIQQFESIFKKIESICPNEVPSLIHGDLWSGNFIVEKNKEVVFIDPSVSYSHREMDLAMSMLFGGFDQKFYDAYQTIFPLAPSFKDRFEIYQLYYLLVHVNLFGGSYINSVKNILNRFS